MIMNIETDAPAQLLVEHYNGFVSDFDYKLNGVNLSNCLAVHFVTILIMLSSLCRCG